MRIAFRLAAVVLAFVILLIDTLSTVEGAVAVLYVMVVLLAARTYRRVDIVWASIGCAALTLLAYVDSHGFNHVGAQTIRAAVSLSAIGGTALLALQHQYATNKLAAQARLLNLSHDMIFVRDNAGFITFWNRSAEEVYGWSSREAVGRVADDLLGTRYPEQRSSIEAALLSTGRWEGMLEQRTKAGATLFVESRWVVQCDHLKRPVEVMETHTDVTDRKVAYAALVASERRFRRMFDASRIGVVQESWSALRAELVALNLLDGDALRTYLASHPEFVGRARTLVNIVDVNPALLTMLHRDPTVPFDALESVDDMLSEGDRTFSSALISFARGDTFLEGETEMVRADGSRFPVLFTITYPTVDDADGTVLVFVVDNTERKQAQSALLASQAELAHATRVATLGELTASIAHEVNQPLMAVVTSGEAGMRWLKRPVPDLHEVETAMGRIISEGRRASEIVKRIRAFLMKAPTQRDVLSSAALIDEAIRLVEYECSREQVMLRLDIEPGLPAIVGDRIQLQQVLVNLMVNACQAMAGQTAARVLSIQARRASVSSLVISVRDTGPGIAAENLDRLFDPFFTTKQQGMGMGLAICRTTAQAHGGELSIVNSPGGGASFQLTLAVLPDGVDQS
ncbi:PAS domain S-box protein [Pigmentiphaga aceris]|uniref:C4-dicarboxylate transport sensor protein DctB n=2 Tax=Pigmentiphaga aceris TaxID=1940612 RepID=A0A5C0B370_9BURK|nr:PAS domain S-box protein [Pigmentiphaga aceris]